MPLLRARLAGLCLCVPAFAGCASATPWPPRAGSCIEASLGKGRHARWHYTVHGAPIAVAEVERVLDPSLVRSAHRREWLWPTLWGSGHLTVVTGAATAAATKSPLAGLILVGALPLWISGVVLCVLTDEPLRVAVARYNEEAARTGVCRSAGEERVPTVALPVSAREVPPVETTLPTPGWTP